MKAYELPVKVTTDGKLDLPHTILKELSPGQMVRIIVLVDESTDKMKQFLTDYNEIDDQDNKLPPEVTDPVERMSLLKDIVERMQQNPIPIEAPCLTRAELHERR